MLNGLKLNNPVGSKVFVGVRGLVCVCVCLIKWKMCVVFLAANMCFEDDKEKDAERVREDMNVAT